MRVGKIAMKKKKYHRLLNDIPKVIFLFVTDKIFFNKMITIS